MMFPFIPDTSQIVYFQTYTYQTININSCYRYELEALPFLTPDQIDIILRRRPYRDWEDFLRKTGFKDYEVEYLKNFLVFGKEKFYKVFIKGGNKGYVLSSGGRNEDWVYNFYLGRDTSFFILKEGFFKVFLGNSKVVSPLGFAGHSGYYSNEGEISFVYYSQPSFGIGIGKAIAKIGKKGVIGGYLSENGGILVSKDSVIGGISFVKFGPFSFEGALSKGSFGFGVRGYSRDGGFMVKFFNGKPFWNEGSQRNYYSLWYRWHFLGINMRIYISSNGERFSLSFGKNNESVRVEYFQVPRVNLMLKNFLAGACPGCVYVGIEYRFFRFKVYSFTKSGIQFYEDAYSSRTFVSSEGYAAFLGFRYKNIGFLLSNKGNSINWEMWFFTSLR
ncbi:MAG: hypothetical protein ABIL16_02885 [candidate division WOR-3 bacterium]